MEGDSLQPNADYFSAVLFTRLMGKEVFHTSTPDDQVQVYAHCARPGQAGFQAGALAVALINLDTQSREVRLSAPGLSATSRRLEYIMTAVSKPPFSQYVNINGVKRLESAADLVGVEGKGELFTLPSQSYGAVLFPDAAVLYCSTDPPTPPTPTPPTPTPPTPTPPAPTPSPPPSPSPSPSTCSFTQDYELADGYADKTPVESKEDCCDLCTKEGKPNCVFQNGKCKFGKSSARTQKVGAIICTQDAPKMV
jgi:hypothetical protein